MTTGRAIATAIRALQRNPLRALLTTLGIVIGVAAVIAMMEIGKGSSESIRKSVASMGANNVLIHPGTASSGGVTFGMGSAVTLTPEDCEAILRECPAVRAAAPIVQARSQIVYGSRNWVPFFISGTTPAYLSVRDWSIAEGEIFSERDIRNSNRVCVIGQTLVHELFQDESPIGQELRIKNVSFRVVGVLNRKGANMMGMDQDDVLLAPWTTIKYRVSGKTLENTNQSQSSSDSSTSAGALYPPGGAGLYPASADTSSISIRFANVDEIFASAWSSDGIPQAIEQMTVLLRERHRIRSGQSDDFQIRDMTEMTKVLSSTTTLMTNLLLSVALISLMVGGVGIMNIMLVSVTERTREIGLRMAVGARGSDILRQFLAEAVFLCLTGGAIGILLGHGGSCLLTRILHWPTATSPAAIVMSILVSASVGILFGFYPAWKASRLDPIDALRYE